MDTSRCMARALSSVKIPSPVGSKVCSIEWTYSTKISPYSPQESFQGYDRSSRKQRRLYHDRSISMLESWKETMTIIYTCAGVLRLLFGKDDSSHPITFFHLSIAQIL
ncbi:hypothetical protein TNCV_4821261 [Trichonephila clavipes]|nr:hypothetical protein TNCV_4821261 [Trichonephila clavipes]